MAKAVCGLMLALGSTAVPGSEPELLAVEGAAIVPLAGESRIWFERLAGSLVLRAGKAGELRFRSVGAEDGVELPLEVRTDGRGLLVRAPESSAPQRRRIEASVPVDKNVRVELTGSSVSTSGLGAHLEILGENLEVLIGRHLGSVDAELEGGTFELRLAARDVDVASERTEVMIGTVNGDVDLAVAGGSLSTDLVYGVAEIDAQEATVTLGRHLDRLRLTAEGGEVLIGEARGAQIRLTAATLELRGSAGGIDIETDAEVQFRDHDGDLHIDSYGGAIRGEGVGGLIEVRAEGADVHLSRISGAVRIENRGNQVKIDDVGGELVIVGDRSSIEVTGAKERVTVHNEFGDIAVHRSAKGVEVRSRDGAVRLSGLTGPVQIDADGPEVFVAWQSLRHSADSSVKNPGGSVTVELPRQGGCVLDAFARYGRIESEHADVHVSEDGTTARGIVNRARRPRVQIESGGDIFISGAGPDSRAPRSRREGGPR